MSPLRLSQFPGPARKTFVQSTKSGTLSIKVRPSAPVVGPFSAMAKTGECVMPSSTTTIVGVGNARSCRIIEMTSIDHGDFTEYSTPLTTITADL